MPNIYITGDMHGAIQNMITLELESKDNLSRIVNKIKGDGDDLV